MVFEYVKMAQVKSALNAIFSRWLSGVDRWLLKCSEYVSVLCAFYGVLGGCTPVA